MSIKKREFQIFFPELFILSLNKNKKIPQSAITIEDLFNLSSSVTDLDVNKLYILRSYLVVAITLLYGAQLRVSGKLKVNKNSKYNTLEKVFQQTSSHSNIVKILSNSSSAKTIYALYAVQYAINVNAFGHTESENTEEGIMQAIISTFEELVEKKGSGNSKVSLRNPETRVEALRAKIASLRSKACSMPTYSYANVVPNGISVKNIKPSDIFAYCETLVNQLIADKIIAETDKFTKEDIIFDIKETVTELGLNPIIDDSNYGTFSPMPIEREIFGIVREETSDTMNDSFSPPFIEKLKSKSIKPKS